VVEVAIADLAPLASTVVASTVPDSTVPDSTVVAAP
jgi:hypothetical protein